MSSARARQWVLFVLVATVSVALFVRALQRSNDSLGDGLEHASHLEASSPRIDRPGESPDLLAEPTDDTSGRVSTQPDSSTKDGAGATGQATLYVRVVAASTQRPLRNVEVSALSERVRVEYEQTDGYGLALLAVPAQRPLEIVAAAPGWLQQSVHVEPLLRHADVELRIELVEEPEPEPERTTFRGQAVASETGSPIAGAEVRLSSAPFSSHLWTMSRATPVATTTEDGRFAVSVDLERESIQVDAAGREVAIVDSLDRESAATPEQRIELARSASITGRIEDAPFGARVEFVVTKSSRSRTSSFLLRDIRFSATVNANGDFDLTGLPPGFGRLEVVSPSTNNKTVDNFLLRPGERRKINWSLRTLAELRGRCIDELGRPVRGLEVKLRRKRSIPIRFHYLHKRMANVDANGRFTFRDVPVGSWTVELDHHSRYACEPVRVEIRDEFVLSEVTLNLHRDLFIEGRVLNLDGEVADECGVYVHSKSSRRRSRRTDPQGYFRVGPLVAGTYHITGHSSDPETSNSWMTVEAGAKDVQLRLGAGGSIRGTVFDDRTGTPASGRVQVQSDEHSYASDEFDNGVFHCSRLAPGRYTIVGTTEDGWCSGEQTVDVVAGQVTEGIVLTATLQARLHVDLVVSKVARVRVKRDGETIALEVPGRRDLSLFLPPGHVTIIRERWRDSKFVEAARLEAELVEGQVTSVVLPE